MVLCDPRHALTLSSQLQHKTGADTKIELPSDLSSALTAHSNAMFDPSLTWSDITWLRTVTDMPIIVKGILTHEDAVLAVDNGVDGIIVSNHGGRQLDSAPATVIADYRKH